MEVRLRTSIDPVTAVSRRVHCSPSGYSRPSSRRKVIDVTIRIALLSLARLVWAACVGARPMRQFAGIKSGFFEDHCMDCHDEGTHKGGLVLESLPFQPADRKNALGVGVGV